MEQTQGYGPIGPQYAANTPSSTPPPSATKVVRLIEDRELVQIVGNQPLSFTQMHPQQLKALCDLVPPEQSYSPDTPYVNFVIFEKQKRDLENMCKNSVYRHPALGIPLPRPAEVAQMNPEQVQQILSALTDRVSQLIGTMGLSPQVSAASYLRNADSMVELLSLSRFVDFTRYDIPMIFSHKQEIEKFLIDCKDYSKNLLHIILGKTHKQIDDVPGLRSLYQKLEATEQSINASSTPENFHEEIRSFIRILVEMDKIKQKLLEERCRLDKSSFEEALSYVPNGSKFSESIAYLFEGPVHGQEQSWFDQEAIILDHLYQYAALINSVREFLSPYVAKEITPATENVNRGELKDLILPRFRMVYPGSQMTDGEIEHFLLSAYLREGTFGIDLKTLEKTHAKYLLESEPASAAETLRTAEEHLSAFTAALLHSLRIDFRSMNLSDQEVGWLARRMMLTPKEPLPLDWRLRAASGRC